VRPPSGAATWCSRGAPGPADGEQGPDLDCGAQHGVPPGAETEGRERPSPGRGAGGSPEQAALGSGRRSIGGRTRDKDGMVGNGDFFCYIPVAEAGNYMEISCGGL